MKKYLLSVAALALTLGVVGYWSYERFLTNDFLMGEKGEKESGEQAVAKQAAEYRMSRMLDENGEYKPEYIARAIQQANKMSGASASRAGGLNMQWEELGPNNIGGRTRSILFDNRDPQRRTIYAGGVAGGLWKSMDKGESWKYIPLPDVLAISCMAQAKNGTIFMGTGEGLAQVIGTRFSSGSTGNGVYKLTGNDNIEHLASTTAANLNLTNSTTWSEVNRIAVDPNNSGHIIAGTGTGMMESVDGGVSWVPITNIKTQSGTNVNPGSFTNVADLDFSADGQYVYASTKGGTLFYSEDVGQNWVIIPTSNSASAPSGSTIFLPNFTQTRGRLEIATAVSDPAVAYLSFANAQGGGFHGYKTSDHGHTWVKIGEAGSTFSPFGDNNQGWYDNVIAVNPFNADQVFLGGTQLYTYSSGSGWKLATIYFGEPNNQYWIHADLHAIAFNDLNKNEMFVGCDGGLFRSDKASDNFPNPPFYVKNRGFNITQAYSVAAGPSGDVMCGNQDNGTTYVPFNYNSTGSAKSIRGGDGVFTEISNIDENVFIYGVYYGDIVRSNNKGVAGSFFYDIAIDPNGGNNPTRCGNANNTRFITNFFLEETRDARNSVETVNFTADKDYNAGDVVTVKSRTKATFEETLASPLANGSSVSFPDRIQSRFYLPTNCGLWMTPDVLDFGGTTRWFRIRTGVNPNAVVQTHTGDTLYYVNGTTVYKHVGVNSIAFDSAFVKSGSGTTLWNRMPAATSSTIPSGGRSIEDLAVDKNNPNHLIAVAAGFSSNPTSNNVFKSINGGQTWTNISNNMPNVPAYSCVIDANNPDNYLVATEIGVFSSSDAGLTWQEENTGLGRVPVHALRQIKYLNDDCYMVYLGTHGRGMWRSSTLLKGGCQLNPLAINDPRNAEKLNQLSIYPVPMSSTGTIEIDMAKVGDVTFRIIDLPGRLVKEIKAGKLAEGKQTFKMDVSDLSTGTYIFSATIDNKKSYTKTLIIGKN